MPRRYADASDANNSAISLSLRYQERRQYRSQMFFATFSMSRPPGTLSLFDIRHIVYATLADDILIRHYAISPG